MSQAIDFDSHRYDALIEDAWFLFKTGVPWVDACERLGVSEDALEKLFYRRGGASDGESDPYLVALGREEAPGWPVPALWRAWAAVASPAKSTCPLVGPPPLSVQRGVAVPDVSPVGSRASA